jgi:helicase required for RNAi-mediated heterochromatin assembly 1
VTLTTSGIAFRVQFSTRRAGKRIHWEYSSRLIAGNIIALSPVEDSFSTKCIVGVVAARPLENLAKTPPEVDIYFAHPEDIKFDPQQEWIMVQARSGYYEAHRHTMKALQKLSQEK